MCPSSRTPEGDRIRCDLCGSVSDIDPSQPPGDVTCPACGTLIWVAAASNLSGDHPKQGVLAFVTDVRRLADSAADRKELGDQLVSGLKHCMPAEGATLWVCSRGRQQFDRVKLTAECTSGQADSSNEFAKRIVNDPKRQPTFAEDTDRAVLRLGVPVTTNGRTTGVIQDLKRPEALEGAKRGYLVFMEQLAEIVATSQAFSA